LQLQEKVIKNNMANSKEAKARIEYINNIEKVRMNPVRGRGTLRALATSNGMNPTVLELETCLQAGMSGWAKRGRM